MDDATREKRAVSLARLVTKPIWPLALLPFLFFSLQLGVVLGLMVIAFDIYHKTQKLKEARAVVSRYDSLTREEFGMLMWKMIKSRRRGTLSERLEGIEVGQEEDCRGGHRPGCRHAGSF